jgi:hypothetical protein
MKRLFQRIHSAKFKVKFWFRSIMGSLFLLSATAANASMIAAPVCRVFRQIAGNDLYSILAGIGGVGILAANAVDEGDKKMKTGLLRIGLVTAGALNIENLSTIVTGTPWGC